MGDAWDLGGGSSGSSSGGGVWVNGGGGSGSRKSSKKRRPSNPKIDNIRIAARLLKIKDPHSRAQAEKKVGEVFSGLNGKQITRIGQKAGLDPGDVNRIQTAIENTEVKQGAPDWGAVAWPVDLLDRVTGRPIRRGLVKSKGLRDPVSFTTGAYEGLVEGKSNPGSQAVIALATGGTEKETAKAYKKLPGWAKVTGDIFAETLLDPSTALTFGVSPMAEAAARTAARQLAGDAAQHAALSPKALEIYKGILAGGKKSLTKDQLAELPGAVRRRLNRNKGGVRFAGGQVPGTAGLGRNMGPKKEGGVLAAFEQKMRTRGAVRQAERRGELPVGTTTSVENVTAGVKGGKYLANLKPREYEKAAQAISKQFGEDDLDVVREALDVAGGRVARDAIVDPKAQALANKLREMSAEDFQKAIDLGRLRPDTEILDQHRQLEMFGDDIDLLDPTTQDKYYPRVSIEPRRPPHGRGDTTGRAPGYIEARRGREPASQITDAAGDPIYEQNPIVAFGRHAKDVQLDETYVNAWKELQSMGDPNTGLGPVIASQPDIPASSVKAADPDKYADYEVISRPVQRDIGGEVRTTNEEILVHKSIKDDFEKVMDLTSQGESSRKIIDTIDNLNAVWASWATATPGFVARNVIQGNFFMGGVLAGAANPKVWAHQLNVMRQIAKGIRQAGNPYAFVKPADKYVVEQAIRNNIVESSFIQSIQDLGDEATRFATAGNWARRGKASPISVNFAPIKAIRDVNKYFENWSRLSVFANKMKQGFAPPEAGFITRKYMIDYTDLAPANQAARHVSPFLTWTYKSVPMILGTLAKDPRKVTIPLHITNAINAEGMRSEGLGYLPEYQTEGGGMVVPKSLRERLPGVLGDNPLTIMGADPIHSTLSTISPVKDWVHAAENVLRGNHPEALAEAWRKTINGLGLGGSLGGLIQWGLETQAGQEFFSGQEFQPGQQVPTPQFLRDLTGGKIGKTMDWSTYNALTNTFPLVSRLEAVRPSTDYAKDAQPRRAVSQLAGIQAYPVTAASLKGEMYRRREILNAFKKALEGRGVKIPDSTATPRGGSKSGNPFG